MKADWKSGGPAFFESLEGLQSFRVPDHKVCLQLLLEMGKNIF